MRFSGGMRFAFQPYAYVRRDLLCFPALHLRKATPYTLHPTPYVLCPYCSLQDPCSLPAIRHLPGLWLMGPPDQLNPVKTLALPPNTISLNLRQPLAGLALIGCVALAEFGFQQLLLIAGDEIIEEKNAHQEGQGPKRGRG